MLGLKNTIIAVLICLMIGWVYSQYQFKQGIELGRNQAIAEQAMVNEVARETREIVLQETAKMIGGLKIENKTIYNKTQKETIREQIYSDCIVTPDGVSNANEALSPRR